MLSDEVSGESRLKNKALPYRCQVESKPSADAAAIFERILTCLDAKNAPDIARKLGLSKQSVYDWRESVPSLENLIRIASSGNASLDWLVTGEGERRVSTPAAFSIEEVLEEKIRRVVREEMQSFTAPVQDLGTIDEFDLAESIRKHDNPGIVLQEWYSHEGLPIENIAIPAFKGWDKMTVEEKAAELKAFIDIRRRHRDFRKNVLPPKAS
jgi:hypothetical protein